MPDEAHNVLYFGISCEVVWNYLPAQKKVSAPHQMEANFQRGALIHAEYL